MSPSQEWAMACDHQWFSPLGMVLPRNVNLVWICFPTIFNNMGICTCVGVCPPTFPPHNVDYAFKSSSISTTFCAHSSQVYQNKNHNIVLPFSLPHTSCHRLNILGSNMVESISESCRPSTTHPHHFCVSPNWNYHQTWLPMIKNDVENERDEKTHYKPRKNKWWKSRKIIKHVVQILCYKKDVIPKHIV